MAKKPLRIPRKELLMLLNMADEMANCTSYMVRDPYDEESGGGMRDPKIDRALDKVRTAFGLTKDTR
jgi:hypothetical protein